MKTIKKTLYVKPTIVIYKMNGETVMQALSTAQGTAVDERVEYEDLIE